MSSKTSRYYFNEIPTCNMCGASAEHFSILGKRLNGSQGKNPSKKMGITTTIIKCKNCELIFPNPQPIPFDIQDHYGIPPETYWTQEYLTVRDSYFLNEINTLRKLQPFEDGMKSLDIGAGIGKSMIAMAKAGYQSYGFEASEPFYERAIRKMGISPNHLKLGMIENVDYPENTFDFITFGAVLEHLYDPANSIEKALKWLKPGGIIQIEVPSSGWLTNKIINFYYKLRKGDYVANLSPMHEPYHLYEFSLKSFEKHAQVYNYTIAQADYYVCDTYLPKVLDGILKPYMKRTNQGMQLCVWLKKN
jgi:2-polyprenyl-3-methyl-5-hydroxy-6-metoxy-1,4-benzoquinol methylase